MPRPRPGADHLDSRRNEKKSRRTPPFIARSPSDRLHLALVVALVVVALTASAFPLTRSGANAKEPSGTPVIVVSDGFSAALHSQAQTLVSALTQAGPVAAPQDAAISQSLNGFPGAVLVPRPLMVAAASVLVQGTLAGPEGQQGLALELQQPVRFTLHEGGFPSVVFSTRPTVGGALMALGAEYTDYDIISPSPDTPLTAGLHVFVERATAVTLSVGGKRPVDVYTHAETVAELLAEGDIELTGGDSVTPAPARPLRDGLAISVTVVGEKIEVQVTPIPFRTIYRNDPDLTQGQSVLAQVGIDGYARREYAVIYRNGDEVSRKLLSEAFVAPDHEIIVQGTAVVAVAAAVAATTAPSAPSGDPNCARTLTVWATWYTAASAGGSGRTATGTIVQKGTVAVDPSVIPMGTRMYIPGYGYGVAEDTGGAIVGNIIDLGYGPNDVWDWSSRYVDICIL